MARKNVVVPDFQGKWETGQINEACLHEGPMGSSRRYKVFLTANDVGQDQYGSTPSQRDNPQLIEATVCQNCGVLYFEWDELSKLEINLSPTADEVLPFEGSSDDPNAADVVAQAWGTVEIVAELDRLSREIETLKAKLDEAG